MLLTFGNCDEGRGIHLEDVVLFEKASQSHKGIWYHMTVMKVEWVRHKSWSILAQLRQTVLRIWMIGWQWHRLSSGPGCWSQQNPTWAAKILQPSVLEGFKNTVVSCQVHNTVETCLRSLLKNVDRWLMQIQIVISQNVTSMCHKHSWQCEDAKNWGPIWRAKTLSYFKSSTRNMVKHSSWPIWALEQLAKV